MGPVYTWMVGDIDAALARSDAELDVLSPPARRQSMQGATFVATFRDYVTAPLKDEARFISCDWRRSGWLSS